MKLVREAGRASRVIGPSWWVAGVAAPGPVPERTAAGRHGQVSGPERCRGWPLSCHRPACRGGSQPKERETGEVVGRGEQGEVRADAQEAAHACSAPPVTASGAALVSRHDVDATRSLSSRGKAIRSWCRRLATGTEVPAGHPRGGTAGRVLGGRAGGSRGRAPLFPGALRTSGWPPSRLARLAMSNRPRWPQASTSALSGAKPWPSSVTASTRPSGSNPTSTCTW